MMRLCAMQVDGAPDGRIIPNSAAHDPRAFARPHRPRNTTPLRPECLRSLDKYRAGAEGCLIILRDRFLDDGSHR
jgi:hypothetical protein